MDTTWNQDLVWKESLQRKEKDQVKLGEIRENIKKIMPEAYTGLEKIQKGLADSTVTLHHSRGTQLFSQGQNVLEFDLAGSGYQQFHRRHKGVGGKSNAMTVKKGVKVKAKFKDLKKLADLAIKDPEAYERELAKLPYKTEKQRALKDTIMWRVAEINEGVNLVDDIYGKQEAVEGFGKLEHVRSKTKAKRLSDNEIVTKKRVTMSGTLSMGGSRNAGEYSIEKVREYVLSMGQSYLTPIFQQWQNALEKAKYESFAENGKLDEADMADFAQKIHPVTIIMKGHSRGGVAMSHGAMMIKYWLSENYPQFESFVKFETTHYDPVAGTGSDSGLNSEVNISDATDEMTKEELKKNKMKALGDSAESTVVYSLHTQYNHNFSPQTVKGAKRIILTADDHYVGLETVDATQRDLHRGAYTDAKTGEVYRGSGINSLEEGLYIADEKNALVKVTDKATAKHLLEKILKGAKGQEKRHNRINDVIDAYFEKTTHNISEIIADEVKDSDSKEMKSVKQTVAECSALINISLLKGETAKTLGKRLETIARGYSKAIEACNNYIEKKNPWTDEGKRRKKAVEDTLATLSRELSQISRITFMIDDNVFQETYGKENVKIIDILRDFDRQERELNSMEKESEEKLEQKKKTGLAAYEYENFEKIINSADVLQALELKNGKLHLIDYDVMSKSGVSITESNKKLLDRYVDLALSRLESKRQLSEVQKANLRVNLIHQLGANSLDIKAEPLSIMRLKRVNDMIERMRSDVEQALKDKEAPALDKALAKTVNKTLSIPENWGETNETVKKLQNVMKDAKKAGLKIPSISGTEMSKLVSGNINAIRDELYNRLKVFCENTKADFNAVAGEQEVINNLLACVIYEKTAATGAGERAAVLQIIDILKSLDEKLTANAKKQSKAQPDQGEDENAAQQAELQQAESQSVQQAQAEQIQQAESQSVQQAQAEQIQQAQAASIEKQAEHSELSREDIEKSLDGLNDQAKTIVAVLLQQSNMSDKIKKQGDENAKNIASVYFALRQMSTGEDWADVYLATTKLTFRKDENGVLEIKSGRKRISMPYKPEFLMHRIEQDVCKNVDKYGSNLVQDVMQDKFGHAYNNSYNEKTANASRAEFLNIIKQKTGIEADFLRNIPSTELSRMAYFVLNKKLDEKGIKEMVGQDSANQEISLNEQDTLEAVRALEEEKRLHLEEKVVVREATEQVNENEVTWTKDEKQLIDLFADLIFSKDTWKTDLEKREPADRIRRLMYDNVDLIVKIIKDPKFIEKTLDRVNMSGMEDMREKIKDQFKLLTEDESIAKLRVLSDQNILLSLKAVLSDESEREANQKAFMQSVEKMAEASGKAAVASLKGKRLLSMFSMSSEEKEKRKKETVQEKKEREQREEKEAYESAKESMMKEFEEGILGAREMLSEKFGQIEDETNASVKESIDMIQGKINEQVDKMFDAKEQQKELIDMDLNEIIKANVKGQEGQGRFMKNILKGYFVEASLVDQKAMIASAIRNMKPSQLKKGQKPTSAQNDKIQGEFLGGFLKGAGPLLHKTLQGFSAESMPETLKIAVADMKSNLLPISPEIVKARMNKMVNDSNGTITKIEVQQSLGAASIGQAFLCKIYGPNMKNGSKDVVVKLLRPDVQNHLAREEAFMIKCASFNEGMKKTFEGQLASIKEELDLRQEAKNVEEGKIYDKGVKTVQAMKLVDYVTPDMNSMMLERADGTTVDSYLKDVRSQIDTLMKQLDKEKNVDGGYAVMKQLDALKKQLIKRHAHVCEVSRKWLVAGIYEEGFYHGDLHAGNIMIDDEKATIIDFGNATKITKEQQRRILHLVSAASYRNIEGFSHHFYKLLSPETAKEFPSKRKDFENMLKIVFAKNGDVGLTISVVLSEAQKMGLELPAPVYKFSQCQIRLKNTVDDMATQIQALNFALNDIATEAYKIESKDPLHAIKKSVIKNSADRYRKETYKEKGNVPSLEEEVRSKLHEAKSKFDRKAYLEKIAAVPENMWEITSSHKIDSAIDSIHSFVKLVEMFRDDKENYHEQLMQLRAGIEDSVEDIRKEVASAIGVHTKWQLKLKDIKDRMLSCCEKEVVDTTDAIAIMNELYDLPVGDAISPYLNQLGELRKLERADQPNQEAITTQKEKLTASAEKIYREHENSPLGHLEDMLLSKDENAQAEFEKIMKSYFVDETAYGPQLKDVCERIKTELASGKTLAEDSVLLVEFRTYVENAVLKRAKEVDTVVVETKTTHKWKEFYEIMKEVVDERLFRTCMSLGATGIARYLIKNNNKQYAQLEQEMQQRREQKNNAESEARAKEIEDANDKLKNLTVALSNLNTAVTMMRELHNAKPEETEKINNLKNYLIDIVTVKMTEPIYEIKDSKFRGEMGQAISQFAVNSDLETLGNIVQSIYDGYMSAINKTNSKAYSVSDFDNIISTLKNCGYEIKTK